MSQIALYVAAALYLIASLTTEIPHMRVCLLCYAIANVALTRAV